MNPALRKLIRLMNWASLRILLRGARTVRGALLLLFLFAVLAGWLGMVVFVTFFLGRDLATAAQAGKAEPYLALFLLAICLQSILGRRAALPIVFTPAEVDFLFTGPFSRRELLIYKLYRQFIGVVIAALIFSLTPVAIFFRGWLPCFVGLALSLIFVNLISVASGLVQQLVAEAAHTRVRKVGLIALGALVAVALPQMLAGAGVFRFDELATTFSETWPGRILLAPFQLFTRATFAERLFPDFIGWTAAAATIDVGLLALVLRLDADYLESSAAASQKVYEQLQRMRQGGGFAANLKSGAERLRIPQLPWLGGAGPSMWRQIVQTARLARPMVRAALTIGLFLVIWNSVMAGRMPGGANIARIGVGIMSYATTLLCLSLPVSFRGDIQQIDFLKTLPSRPVATAAGQVIGCALVLWAIQLLILAICSVLARTVDASAAVAAVVSFPVNVVLLAAGNLIFLMFPVRTDPGVQFDLNRLGRGCLAAFFLMAMLFILLGISAGLGAATYMAFGREWAVGALTASAALLIESVPLVLLLGRAFDRFDPSTETPT